ncbi:MAG: glycoside hydrolase [Rubripirellula sp.]
MKDRRTALLVLMGALGLFESRQAAAQNIQIDTSVHNHRFEAWGTSLAWMGNEIGGQSNAQGREDMMDILFDPTNGLGLNFVRYNIGAGSNPDTSVQNITRPGAKMEGWVPDAPTSVSNTSTWNWNWNADANQRLILDMAIERGVTQVEAFANSAPWWMTNSLSSSGTSSSTNNLSTANQDEFAHYMLEVTDHFEENLGIQFNTITPVNEPGSGFWNGSSNQEGMGISSIRQRSLITTFGQELDARNSRMGLVGPEETSTDQSGDTWNVYSSTTKSHIDQVNTHTYSFNGGSTASDSQRLFDMVSADGKKIYATEYGTGQGAVRLATQINLDIRHLDAAGWTYWQAVEDNNGSGWGLAIQHFNGTNPRFDTQDQYFAMKQFAAHIRPGAEILELAGQDDITAAYDPRTGTTAVVVTNDGADGSSQNYSFDMLDRQVMSTRLIRTTDENNGSLTNAYQSLGGAAVNGGTNVSFDAEGNAITTLVMHHRPNLVENGSFDLGTQGNGAASITGWQSTGNAAYDTGSDLTGDGSGSGRLETGAAGNSGTLFQTGIGDSDTDLTGMAFQLSADVRFLNGGNRNYDADTFLGLEFYGADDQTLASVLLSETEIEPSFAVKRNNFESSVDGSDPNDNEYRTYRSERFVAPEGTRYVRPVIRFENVNASSTDWSFVDNVYLGEVHPEAAAREWNGEGGGEWADNSSWLNHALVENNRHAYFGNAIEQASDISINSTQAVTGLTFFSEHQYNLVGTGNLEVGDASSADNGLIDVRWGDHLVSVDTQLMDNLELQVLPDAKISFESSIDLAGHHLMKLGSGDVEFNSGFVMNGGVLSAYGASEASIFLGADTMLDGNYEMLIAPGQMLQFGDSFELAAYTSLNDSFDDVLLPTLSDGLVWDVNYGSNRLTAAVITAVPEPASGMLLATGVLVVLTRRRKRS